ncbi:hypothetical protein [Noviherbaspirillum galbum]|uniref:Uncharacterized protein n=1 Tax=Noviherbaspirillum galbum TaxID=2709383 RepID=A0A6B3SR05_9BURK|nr:hypothetical protein [Noviherbaspirillum galbum]NEX61196.1 hypothetical protein [Noviherbaspirillum galbum]
MLKNLAPQAIRSNCINDANANGSAATPDARGNFRIGGPGLSPTPQQRRGRNEVRIHLHDKSRRIALPLPGKPAVPSAPCKPADTDTMPIFHAEARKEMKDALMQDQLERFHATCLQTGVTSSMLKRKAVPGLDNASKPELKLMLGKLFDRHFHRTDTEGELAEAKLRFEQEAQWQFRPFLVALVRLNLKAILRGKVARALGVKSSIVGKDGEKLPCLLGLKPDLLLDNPAWESRYSDLKQAEERIDGRIESINRCLDVYLESDRDLVKELPRMLGKEADWIRRDPFGGW